jgi:hypothetical protein
MRIDALHVLINLENLRDWHPPFDWTQVESAQPGNPSNSGHNSRSANPITGNVPHY